MNGTQLTMSGGTQPGQNQDFVINNNTGHALGTLWRGSDSGGHWNGHMAQAIFCDGQSLAPTSFGSTNSDGVWIPNASPSVTYGTNGFKIDFKGTGASADTSGFGADSSGNNNHFATTNIGTNPSSKDSPTNNFATWNPNIAFRTASFASGAAGSITDAGLKAVGGGGANSIGFASTIAVNSGKWYAECKYHAGSNHYGIIGVADEVFAVINDLGSSSSTDLGKTGSALGSDPSTCTVAYVINTGKIRNNNNNQDYGSGGGDGDIINIALDRDNRKVYFGINGTYENSGNPGSGSNGFDLSSQVTGDTYFLGVSNDTGASETILDFNFGGGFGQTAVSSGNSDANGHGNFEYAVPSGFYAWNSKNLAEFG